MANKIFKLLWKHGTTRRVYVNGTGYEIQIGKYRGLDDFDKSMNTKPTWHNKWYVDDMHIKPKLFNTEKQATIYFMKLISKIYKTKQL